VTQSFPRDLFCLYSLQGFKGPVLRAASQGQRKQSLAGHGKDAVPRGMLTLGNNPGLQEARQEPEIANEQRKGRAVL
jgi:hypothetical protein